FDWNESLQSHQPFVHKTEDPCPRPRCLVDWNRFSSTICLCLAPSMLPFPVPPAENQLQSIMLRPPCLIKRMVLPGCLGCIRSAPNISKVYCLLELASRARGVHRGSLQLALSLSRHN
ncbi:hypothetical protein PGIGA_G00180500, partial [Pangasianodon gigas]|nr:hypothetical protein [Pangasianodon gigas]